MMDLTITANTAFVSVCDAYKVEVDLVDVDESALMGQLDRDAVKLYFGLVEDPQNRLEDV